MTVLVAFFTVSLIPALLAAQSPASSTTTDRSAERITAALAVATFDSAWSRVRNAHYDTAMRGIDWSGVRAELRPRAERAETLGELRAIITDMLTRLGESHYGIIRKEADDALPAPASDDAAPAREPGDVGMSLRLIGTDVVVSHVVPGGPADRAGVRAGWIVDSVGRFTRRRGAAGLSRLTTDAERRMALVRVSRAVTASFEGPAGSAVRAAFRDGAGRAVVARMTRRATPGEPVQFPNLPPFLALLEHERRPLGNGSEGCIGVIRFNIWMTPLADDFDRAVDALRDCRGIVIDLRGNLGGLGFMVAGVGGHFLDSVVSLGTMRTRAGELRFAVNPRRATVRGEATRPYAGPLAILVDPLTGSTSEVFAAGMQAIGRARIFGETSAGQALPAMATRLPTGDVLLHVTADLVDPHGRRVEGRGVVPDESVSLERSDLLAGRDAPLDAALRWIASQRPLIP